MQLDVLLGRALIGCHTDFLSQLLAMFKTAVEAQGFEQIHDRSLWVQIWMGVFQFVELGGELFMRRLTGDVGCRRTALSGRRSR